MLATMKHSLTAEKPGAFPETAFDYARIEKAIGFLHEHFLEQPDLAAVARAVHLSEYHFQRLFTRWAGISPKRFVQFLTVEYAKNLLADSKAMLETALDAGLTGPGRLHDLFVSVEAVTPGEFKSRGAGIRVEFGFHSTPFGDCLLGTTPRGICWLSFLGAEGPRAAVAEMRARWGGAEFAEARAKTQPLATQIFERLQKPNGTPLSLLLLGTNFQLKVWQALLKIPPGSVVAYGGLGELLGAPNSSRAIGTAVGQNPIACLIPCHRVIRKTGLLGGYRWGEPRKRALLAWEAAHRE
jgi:AraC family transcriptional regulator of adaptative response/methylated-DNA-[protein]-cysteine methyltransferase